MSTITRERLEQYANDPRMCNVNDEIRQMARIALASLEAEPVVWRYRHHNGLAPSIWKYVDSAEECKSAANYQCQALYAAPQPLTTSERAELENYRNAQQVVPGEYPDDSESVCIALERCRTRNGAFQRYKLGWDDCRAAMLQGKADGTLIGEGTRNHPEDNLDMVDHSGDANEKGSSPVIPDGWVACSERVPETDWKVLANVKSTAVEYQCLAEIDENGRWWDEYGEQLPSPFVTHWMPLPAAPQQELFQTGVLIRIAAVKTEDGGWRLFGVWRDKDIAVFVEAARGGIREWSGLDYLAGFVASCGISLWEVHNKTERQGPV